MPERGFDTGFWTEEYILGLPAYAKHLLHYLGSNDHCNQAGVYHIGLKTISFESGIPESDLPALFGMLEPAVKWLPEEGIVWVKDFLRQQAKSPKFIIAAIKALNHLRVPEDIVSEFETYNEELLRGIAPSEHVSPTKRECVIIRDDFHCQYCGKELTSADDYEMDHILPITRGGKENYLNLVAACRRCNQKKLDKTPGEAGMKIPTPTPFHGAQATYILRNNESLRSKWLKVFPDRYKVVESILINVNQYQTRIPSVSDSVSDSVSSSSSVLEKGEEVVKGKGEPQTTLDERTAELLRLTRSLKHWRTTPDDEEWLLRFLQEFPEFSREMMTACTDYYSDRPDAKHKGDWKNRLRNWMIKKHQFDQERRQHGQTKGERVKAHSREDFRGGKW